MDTENIIYFCEGNRCNYEILIDKGFKDINNCGNRLLDKIHIRFDINTKVLYWENVGTFTVNPKAGAFTVVSVSSDDLKNIMKGVR